MYYIGVVFVCIGLVYPRLGITWACMGFVDVAQIRVERRGLFHYWKCFIKLALVHMISLGIHRINKQELKLESSRYTHETKSYNCPNPIPEVLRYSFR